VLRAVPGWLSARTPEIFPVEANALDGDAGCAPRDDARHAASGGANGPVDYHLPVLTREVGEWMAAGPGKRIVDGTLGGGGHSAMFLDAGASVLGVDRDPEAIAFASRRLASHGERFRTWAGNYADFLSDPEVRGEGQADGLLLDLGVSSRQLDEAARGFSFMRQGPLDMRMGPSSPRTAADVVNGWSEGDLVRLLFEFGEEPKARRIASAIIARRTGRPFETTTDLADCIERAVGRSGRTHPATRSFQAIRIAVNDELDSLRRALELAPEILKPGGRLLIITFHSLEDRMVKRYFQARSAPWLDDPTWPEPRPNPDRVFRLPMRKALAPSADEISRNPRARSAKLRVAERLDPTL
jgi:16S rRNA (cytosine1402-N4)-methyltransferase